MISQLCLRIIRTKFLLLCCLASSMLIGMHNKKFSVKIMPKVVILDTSTEIIYPILVIDKIENKCIFWAPFKRPVKSVQWDEKVESLLVQLDDGTILNTSTKRRSSTW